MSTLLFVRGLLVFGIVAGLCLLLSAKGRRAHPRWMTACIAGDLALLVYVVVVRQPIQKTIGLSQLSTSAVGLTIHVVTALGLLISYVGVWQLGRAAARARAQGAVPAALEKHRMMGLSVVLFLVANYATTPGFVFDWLMP